ncbi:hypothetical protein [Trueperella pyogenes]|uniref:hypothetical protein n=1 Tax=Trueperella pyogenes TaxID=1661 RepID=UPI0032544781
MPQSHIALVEEKLNIITCKKSTIVAIALSASLTFGPAGITSASEQQVVLNHSPENTDITYPVPSANDVLLYGTSDPETVCLLNKMSEDFAKYGDQGAYSDLEIGTDVLNVPSLITTQSWNSFTTCVGSGLAKSFGLDVLKRAFDSEVRSALKSHKWKVASSIMHRNLTEILGKKGTSLIIKKIASKALPEGLPGQVAWQVGKCGL